MTAPLWEFAPIPDRDALADIPTHQTAQAAVLDRNFAAINTRYVGRPTVMSWRTVQTTTRLAPMASGTLPIGASWPGLTVTLPDADTLVFWISAGLCSDATHWIGACLATSNTSLPLAHVGTWETRWYQSGSVRFAPRGTYTPGATTTLVPSWRNNGPLVAPAAIRGGSAGLIALGVRR